MSGYNLDSLLPENGFHVAKALVGSESTLVTVLQAELNDPHTGGDSLAVLGFDDVASAADAVPAVLEHHPAALEGLDHRLVELEHSQRLADKALRQLPDGAAWLMVQLDGDNQDDADRKAKSMIDALNKGPAQRRHGPRRPGPQEGSLVCSGRRAWAPPRIRPTSAETHEGWEDAAVPPERLGDYLRDFHELLDRCDYGTRFAVRAFRSGLRSHPYPIRLAQRRRHRQIPFVRRDSARLVVAYGGSLSGEHGDGQSRGELLPIMFGERMVERSSRPRPCSTRITG